MTKDNLPAEVVEQEAYPVIYEPPASFEVVDRGSATPVSFTHLGDSFVGIYEGTDDVVTEDGEHFDLANFTGADGKPYGIFLGPVLKRAMRKVEIKQWCRITYNLDIDTGKPSPLKSYVVEVGR